FCPDGAFVRDDENTTRLPSGVQPCTLSAPGCHVSRRGSPPDAGTTYTSVLPPYCALNAIQLPSGENDARVSCPSKLVSRVALPPLRGTTQMSFAYSNAMCVALIVGRRSRRVEPLPLSPFWLSCADAGEPIRMPRSAIARPPGMLRGVVMMSRVCGESARRPCHSARDKMGG